MPRPKPRDRLAEALEQAVTMDGEPAKANKQEQHKRKESAPAGTAAQNSRKQRKSAQSQAGSDVLTIRDTGEGGGFSVAEQTLRQIANDPDASHSARVSAARALDQMEMRGRLQSGDVWRLTRTEIRDRIAQLENMLKE